jgi:hypothetical protein
MSKIPAGFEPLDPGRVNVMDPVELKYWCKQFGCTEHQLNQIVARVGEHVAVVRQALGAKERRR